LIQNTRSLAQASV